MTKSDTTCVPLISPLKKTSFSIDSFFLSCYLKSDKTTNKVYFLTNTQPGCQSLFVFFLFFFIVICVQQGNRSVICEQQSHCNASESSSFLTNQKQMLCHPGNKYLHVPLDYMLYSIEKYFFKCICMYGTFLLNGMTTKTILLIKLSFKFGTCSKLRNTEKGERRDVAILF